VCRRRYNRDILAVNGALLVEVEKALEFVNENLKMQLGQAFLSAVQALPTLHTSCPALTSSNLQVDKFKIYSAYVNNFDTRCAVCRVSCVSWSIIVNSAHHF
jgi:hypothetical protein